MEFAELIEQFVAARRAAGLSAHSVTWYSNHLRVFYRWLCGNPSQSPLAVTTIEAFYNARRAQGLEPETIHGDHRVLRVFYRWLIERGYIERSPVEAVKLRKPPRKAPRRATMSDYDRLIASIAPTTWVDHRDRLLLGVLFLCGVRAGEALSLTVGDVNVAAKLLTVRRGKTGARVVPMLPAVKDEFVAYIFERPPAQSDHLFLSAKGDLSVRGVLTTSGIRQMLVRRCQAAGIAYINAHAFRHGLAMHLLNHGGDLSLVQRILGHNKITTTSEHYAQWMTESMQKEFESRMGK